MAKFGHVIYMWLRKKLNRSLAQFPLTEIEFTYKEI